MGQMGRKAEGVGDVGFFPFSFILAFVFPFLILPHSFLSHFYRRKVLILFVIIV